MAGTIAKTHSKVPSWAHWQPLRLQAMIADGCAADAAMDGGARQQRPVVLLAASDRWISTARLALALNSLGCCVHLAAPRDHPALSTDAIHRRHAYNAVAPLRTLRRAIERSRAVAVIAADEAIVLQLEELWANAAEGSALRVLLQRSLGGAEVMAAARSRMQLTKIAQRRQVAIPETLELKLAGDVEGAMLHLGVPLMLKADATSGGRGVRMLRKWAGAERVWHELHHPPSLLRALHRGLRLKEWTHLRSWARAERRGISAQRFVAGHERTAMAVCNAGRVVACVCLEVLEICEDRGPSSLLRVTDDAEMTAAVERMAAALGVSGLCGFDFIAEEATGRRLLLEMNPRPTQLVHLPLGPGRDLVAAYLREVAGMRHVQDRPAATTGDTIALFPQELQRNAASAALETAHHDVPWAEPALIKRAMKVVPERLLRDARWRVTSNQPAGASVFLQKKRQSV